MGTAYSPDAWLDLGVVGAALFIVLIIVTSMFSQQRQSIDKLCGKIDSIVNSFADVVTKLTEVTIANDKDQKQLLALFETMSKDVKDIQHRVTRIDTRIYDSMKSPNDTTDTTS